MSIQVLVPTVLRQYTDGDSAVPMDATTVGEALDQLIAIHPDLRSQLLDEDGSVRTFVNVFVNERNIRDDDNRNTPVRSGDEICLVPAIAGG